MLAPRLREEGAEMVVIVSHQREPNDVKLATNLPSGVVDIILGGHDHYYAHSVVNGTHVLRSGTDFKQISYLEAFRKPDGAPGWDFNITRRDIVQSIPEDPGALALVDSLTSSLRPKLEEPIGYTLVPLDSRFSTVRQRESNFGNFVCDLMRHYYAADCAMMAGGTMRGDQIYPPGVLRLKDILNCFPYDDPVVLLRLSGQALLSALENGVSALPALEGRFTQVSNISFGFKCHAPPGSRITFARVGDRPIELQRDYTLATRGYMARGKDGFSSLLVQSEGGHVEELVSEESGVLVSTILRQYFMSWRVLGKWSRRIPSLHRHWVQRPFDTASPVSEKSPSHLRTLCRETPNHGCIPHNANGGSGSSSDAMDSDSDENPDAVILCSPTLRTHSVTLPARSAVEGDYHLQLARRVLRKWMRHAGLNPDVLDPMHGEGEFMPPLTSGISPRLEGRIVIE